MLPDLEAVIRLQRTDLQIAERQKEIAALPKHIEKIEKTLDSHKRKLEIDRAALAANQKERKAKEGDIQIQQQKIAKLRDQLMGAKTNEQYRAFQHEIEFCENEIRKAEDRILDLMQESEPLEARLKVSEGALKEEQKQVEIEKNTARDRAAESQQFLNHLQADRQSTVAGVTPRIYQTYERVRKKYGSAVAEGTDGSCSACRIALRPQFFQDLKRGDQVMFCESCGRILYYNPPIAVHSDAELNQSKA